MILNVFWTKNSVTLETIEARLKFKVHINTLAWKIFRSLGVITKLKQILPRKTLHTLITL